MEQGREKGICAGKPNTSGRFFSMQEPTRKRSIPELTNIMLLDPWMVLHTRPCWLYLLITRWFAGFLCLRILAIRGPLRGIGAPGIRHPYVLFSSRAGGLVEETTSYPKGKNLFLNQYYGEGEVVLIVLTYNDQL